MVTSLVDKRTISSFCFSKGSVEFCMYEEFEGGINLIRDIQEVF